MLLEIRLDVSAVVVAMATTKMMMKTRNAIAPVDTSNELDREPIDTHMRVWHVMR